MSTKLSAEQIKATNAGLNEAFRSQDPGRIKKAAEAINAFIRMEMREPSFTTEILPAQQVDDSELIPSLSTDKPYTIHEREPASPAAFAIPFADTTGTQFYLEGSRFPCFYSRIRTPEAIKDVDELRTYKYDLRQVMSDKLVNGVGEFIDASFINAVNTLVGAVGAPSGYTGEIHHRQLDTLSRDNYIDALNVMTDFRAAIPTSTILMNRHTANEICKWGFDEAGGNSSEERLKNGFYEKGLGAVNFVVTSKHWIVKNGEIFMFATPEKLGVNRFIQDTTMFVKAEGPKIMWYAYRTCGLAFGNISGMAKCTIEDLYVA